MYTSYADVLESYVIAEEGFGDSVKKVGSTILNAIKKLIEKIKNLILTLKTKVANKITSMRSSNNNDNSNNQNNVNDQYDNKLTVKLGSACGHIARYNSVLFTAVSRYNQNSQDIGNVVDELGQISTVIDRLYKEIDDAINNGGRIRQHSANAFSNHLSKNIAYLEKLLPMVAKNEDAQLSKVIGMAITENNKLCSKISAAVG